MDPRRGFEPRFTASKADVLPLDERGMAPAVGVEPTVFGFGVRDTPTRSPAYTNFGGLEGRARTCGLTLPKRPLYQLSYSQVTGRSAAPRLEKRWLRSLKELPSSEHGRSGYMRTAIVASALVLSACATTPPPAIELRTVRVEVPVPVPCIDATKVPTKPGRIASQLTGDASHDLDLVAAHALRLSAWGDQLAAIVQACSK
jgi:hypothetical protein